MYERLEAAHQFVVACGDTAELLEAAEESLDEIAMLVLMRIPGTLVQAIGSRRNDCLGADGSDCLQQRIAVVGLVRYHGIWTQTVEQRACGDTVVDLSRGDQATRKLPQSIDQCVNLGAQPAARAPERLVAVFFAAPAAC